jgi:ketosteroid isomerase-like protein
MRHDEDTDRAAVLDVQAAFYAAFEDRNLDAMSDVWEHSDRVVCCHPGWAPLHGWGAVAASWLGIFQGPQELQFIVTGERLEVQGDLAWSTIEENLLDGTASGAVAALNLYARGDDGRWRMIAHQGSPVSPDAPRQR